MYEIHGFVISIIRFVWTVGLYKYSQFNACSMVECITRKMRTDRNDFRVRTEIRYRPFWIEIFFWYFITISQIYLDIGINSISNILLMRVVFTKVIALDAG